MSSFDRKMQARLAREEREFQVAERFEKWRKRTEQQNKNAEKLFDWYWVQTRRLGVTREDLEAAILRGWCGEQIAELPATEVGKLTGPPPADVDLEDTRQKILAAPIKPICAVGFGSRDRR